MIPITNRANATTVPQPTDPASDFSLILGGPIFQLMLRSRLSGNGLELLHRRILVLAGLAWLPLLLLSLVGSDATSAALPFVRDIEAHVRLLVALPALIIAEVIVHTRARPIVRAFLTRRIIDEHDEPRYLAAIQSAMRLRNSVPVEVVLLLFVLTVGHWLWRRQVALGADTWYSVVQGGSQHLTAAGYWYAFVSIPIFQFVLLRWYLRLFIWFRFLWHVSRLKLHLIATHPDRAGGLGFLGNGAYAFSPILFAQGALLAGLIANRVLYGGVDLMSFKMEAGGFIVFFLIVVLAPLLMFTPQLANAKRMGLRDYGLLASRYVEQFQRKWVDGGKADSDELLGSGDIQSLADLGNSFSAVREMRPIPFALSDVGRLALAAALPLLPLGLVVFSFEELLIRILGVLF